MNLNKISKKFGAMALVSVMAMTSMGFRTNAANVLSAIVKKIGETLVVCSSIRVLSSELRENGVICNLNRQIFINIEENEKLHFEDGEFKVIKNSNESKNSYSSSSSYKEKENDKKESCESFCDNLGNPILKKVKNAISNRINNLKSNVTEREKIRNRLKAVSAYIEINKNGGITINIESGNNDYPLVSDVLNVDDEKSKLFNASVASFLGMKNGDVKEKGLYTAKNNVKLYDSLISNVLIGKINTEG